MTRTMKAIVGGYAAMCAALVAVAIEKVKAARR